MYYRAEFKFLQSVLGKLNLQFLLLSQGNMPSEPPDFGLREIIGHSKEYAHMFGEIPFQSTSGTILKLTDPYLCNYLFLQLPGESPAVLMVGPYMHIRMTSRQLMQESERHGIPAYLLRRIENFYDSVPVLHDDTFLISMVSTLAESLWGSSVICSAVDLTVEATEASILSLKGTSASPEPALKNMQLMEQRYAFENELLNCVSMGILDKAEEILLKMGNNAVEQRVADSVRNLKNYCIIMNTLLRKAAERGGVHPLYLDSISSGFAKKIESITSLNSGYELTAEMLRSYCRLVKNHSTTGYSATVQKALVCIDSDLSGELSLHALAEAQGISPGYLSSVFKKEVGQTLTDYVTVKRIHHAASLLQTTSLQIQTVAQYCGILDVNYFSKIFKRYLGVTPKEFRRTLKKIDL